MVIFNRYRLILFVRLVSWPFPSCYLEISCELTVSVSRLLGAQMQHFRQLRLCIAACPLLNDGQQSGHTHGRYRHVPRIVIQRRLHTIYIIFQTWSSDKSARLYYSYNLNESEYVTSLFCNPILFAISTSISRAHSSRKVAGSRPDEVAFLMYLILSAALGPGVY
jgi:hypothetical protein